MVASRLLTTRKTNQSLHITKQNFLRETFQRTGIVGISTPSGKSISKKKKHQNPFSSKSAVEIEVPDQKMMVAHCQRFVSAAQMVCRVRVVNRRSFFTWQTFSNPQRMWMPTEPMPSRGGFALDLTPLFGKLKNTLRKIEVSNHQDENQLHHHAPLSKKRLIWSSKG